MSNIERVSRHFETTSAILSIDTIKNRDIYRCTLGTSDGILYNLKNDSLNDIYYNKRMGLVHGVEYSACGNYIVSGSDDGSIRLWRTESNQKLYASGREKKKMSENRQLQEKFKDFAEISRIRKHKFLPAEIKNKVKQLNERLDRKKMKK